MENKLGGIQSAKMFECSSVSKTFREVLVDLLVHKTKENETMRKQIVRILLSLYSFSCESDSTSSSRFGEHVNGCGSCVARDGQRSTEPAHGAADQRRGSRRVPLASRGAWVPRLAASGVDHHEWCGPV